MNKNLKLAIYIFLLGLGTYAWWRFTSEIKRRMSEDIGGGGRW